MKKLLILVCALFALSATSFAQKKWQIGDIYEANGKRGVVFAVSKDGAHGRIISPQQTKCKWDEAQQWCSELGEGWRLPTTQELEMIYDLWDNQDFIDGIFFADAPAVMWDQWYWSGEEYDTDPLCALVVSMDDGLTYYNYKFIKNYVRAVSAF